MTDSQEKSSGDARGSRAIRIEIDGAVFNNMRRMMSLLCDFETIPTGCCEMPRYRCGPDGKNQNGRKFTFVIKREDCNDVC